MVGLNTAWYADQKGRWLAELHFRGGFRGLLNNNVGNDIIQSHPRGRHRFLLRDFDSFQLIPIPPAPSREFLHAFAVQCVVEVVKGSLPILEFVSAAERAFESTAFLEASCSVVLSDYALKRHQRRRAQPYVPH
jgi:hypothetical protein